MFVSFLSRYNSLVTGKRAQGIIAICWVLSIVIGLTPMMGWHVTPKVSKVCSPGLVKCLFEEVVLMAYMVYFNFFGCVLIPLLLMLGIYLCIFMAARYQLRLIQLKVVHGEKSGSTLQKEVQAAKSLAIIVGLFAVCWLPLHIINCFTYFCPTCPRAPALIMYTAIILSHGNSVVNPFIYAYRIREFRQTFHKIIRRHILGRRPQLESGGSRRTSIHNSVTDSIRRNTNGLRMDIFNEHSSSSCEISYHCPTDVSVRGGLIAVSHAPLSIIIAHCPHAISCPLQALKQPETSTLANVQHVDGQQNRIRPESTMDKQDLGSAQVSMLLDEQKSNSCFTELALMS